MPTNQGTFFSFSDRIDYQCIRRWWQRRNLYAQSLQPLTINNKRPSIFSHYVDLISALLLELCLHGIPVSKCLLWVVMSETLREPSEEWKDIVSKILDASLENQKENDSLNSESTELIAPFCPSYPTVVSWLKKMNIYFKSAKATMQSSFPANIEELGRNVLLRICDLVRQEWNGQIFTSLLVNMDETAVAYNCLSERTLAPSGLQVGSMALADKRSATLVATAALNGCILLPFVIWNGKERHRGAHVQTCTDTVQCQTENHYTWLWPVFFWLCLYINRRVS